VYTLNNFKNKYFIAHLFNTFLIRFHPREGEFKPELNAPKINGKAGSFGAGFVNQFNKCCCPRFVAMTNQISCKFM